MSLRFCMLESANGGPVAVNVASVVAVGSSDEGHTVVVHQGGQIGVKGVVAEVVLKLLGAAAAVQPDAGGALKKAA